MEDQPIMQPTSPKKFPTIAVVIIAVVLTALIVGGGVYFWQNMLLNEAEKNLMNVQNSLQQQIDDLTARLESPECSAAEPCSGDFTCDKGKCVAPVADQVENWSLYKENTGVQVGSGKCSNQEFNSFLDQANADSRKTLNLNGVILVVTPNYNNWTNEKFVGFGNDNTAFCNVGGFSPLHAYSDKLLWIGGCGTGGAAPELEEPGYVEKMAALKLCETTLGDVNKYFLRTTTPTTYTNNEYKFSLVFPAMWGAIEEKDVLNLGADKYIVKSIDLVSKTDKDRWLKIDVIKIENKNDPENIDYPHTFLKENNQYAFYYYGVGDYAGAPGMEDPKWFVMADEIKQIVKTFTFK
ncbi:MAG: hypothetical protein ABII19_01330 [Patescibacteria group bacterium]